MSQPKHILYQTRSRSVLLSPALISSFHIFKIISVRMAILLEIDWKTSLLAFGETVFNYLTFLWVLSAYLIQLGFPEVNIGLFCHLPQLWASPLRWM